MPPERRPIRNLGRFAHAGMALLRSTAGRPVAPLKVNFCLTYWCQYRCKTCNIWQRKPTDELTTDEVIAFVRENPHVTWADLTGGEIFLRPDIDAILDAVVTGWRRLAILHFATNGFLTDRIVRSVAAIAGRGPATTIVTVSLDGDEKTNDEIRGIQGGFRRQIDTFKALRRIPDITVVLGVTLSSHNAGRFAETFAACTREVPGPDRAGRPPQRRPDLRTLLRQRGGDRHTARPRADSRRAPGVPASQGALAIGGAAARDHVPAATSTGSCAPA